MSINSFSIKSRVSVRELEFSSLHGDMFYVELRDIELFAKTEISSYTDPNGLATFFQSLPVGNTPWTGIREWSTLEDDFRISAKCSSLGVVLFKVMLRGRQGGDEEWQVQFGLETELGQLESIATRAGAFFGNS